MKIGDQKIEKFPLKKDFLALPEAQRTALLAARRYAEKSRADSTWRAYRSDWKRFLDWCNRAEVTALPATPQTVAMFIASEASRGLSPTTIKRRLSAIRIVHLGMEHPSPHDSIKVVEVLRGIVRSNKKPPTQKKPALETDILKMVDAVEPETRVGLRNRAILLFGFMGAFRRSELAALNTWDLSADDRGVVVNIPRSKTDQEQKGQKIAILSIEGSDYCPVQALNDWLTVAEIEEGPIFRRMYRHDTVGEAALTPQSIAKIIKQHAELIGQDPKEYGGHSLRSGFLTSAARRRADLLKMADQSRHKSLETVRKYVRDEDMFDRHAGDQMFED